MHVRDMERLPKMDRACRDVRIRALPAKDGDDFKRFELSISSEYPVRRWFGMEILRHDSDAVDLSRMNDAAPVLLQHDGYMQVGVVESARIRGKRLVAEIMFSRASQTAREVAQDIEDGIRRNVSVGYIAQRAKLMKADDEEGDTWEITRWQPMEVSIVSVPADPTVGINRSTEPSFPVELDLTALEEPTMTTPTTERPADRSRSERRADIEAREDAAEIARLAEKHGFTHRVEGWLQRGLTAEQVSREILEQRAARQPAPSGGSHHPAGFAPSRASAGAIELPRGYSLRNAILSAVDGGGSLEREWSDEYARQTGRTPRRDGVFVHPAALFQRAMDSLTPGKATEIVADQPGELIELLRPVAQVVASGARVMSSLTGPVPFPKQTGSSAAVWVQENPPDDVPEGGPTFGTVTLTPKTLQGYVPFSRQLLVQASINVEGMVREDLAKAHGLAIDRAALHGSGAGNEPLGIYKTPGVNTVAVGGAPTYEKVVDMLAAVAADNAITPGARFSFLMTSGLAAKLMKTVEFATAGSKAVWTGTLLEGIVAGYRAAATNQLSATMSTLEPTGGTSHGIVFGNWAELLIGLWGALELVVDPYTQARKGIIGVTSFQMADIAARHGESFCVGTGATA